MNNRSCCSIERQIGEGITPASKILFWKSSKTALASSVIGKSSQFPSQSLCEASWATENGTGISSPIHLGNSPIEEDGETVTSSSISTTAQTAPLKTILSPVAKSRMKRSSNLPIILRVVISLTP